MSKKLPTTQSLDAFRFPSPRSTLLGFRLGALGVVALLCGACGETGTEPGEASGESEAAFLNNSVPDGVHAVEVFCVSSHFRADVVTRSVVPIRVERQILNSNARLVEFSPELRSVWPERSSVSAVGPMAEKQAIFRDVVPTLEGGSIEYSGSVVNLAATLRVQFVKVVSDRSGVREYKTCSGEYGFGKKVLP